MTMDSLVMKIMKHIENTSKLNASFLWRINALLLVFCASCFGATIEIPNGSFESPETPFVDIQVDSWQKNPKPNWYDESDGFLWIQLAGVFLNTAADSPDHIDNMHGNQALFLFSVPQVGLFQDIDSNEAKYEVGKTYRLNLSVIGGGGAMPAGASLQISLYYRDDENNAINISTLDLVHSLDIYPVTTHFVDHDLLMPRVKATDPWANRAIGIRILTTVSPDLAGGFWDIDNIRLNSISDPILQNAAWNDGIFQMTIEGEAGYEYEVLTSSDPSQPISDWSSLGTVFNETGTVDFIDENANSSPRFYIARQVM
jgi:hypothetical protein